MNITLKPKFIYILDILHGAVVDSLIHEDLLSWSLDI